MNSVISHIEYLLTCHDCVVVPGFGGFVLQHQSASFDKFGNICPPYKSISFNSGLNHNDGLLANSIMEDYMMSYNESVSIISDFVLSVKSGLSCDSDYVFGTLGSFRLNEEGRFVFSPQVKEIDLSNFGLGSFTMNKLNSTQKDDVAPEKDNIINNVSWGHKIFRHAASVAVLIFALFMISHPLDRTNNIENYASIISTSLLKNPVIPVISEDILGETEIIDSYTAESYITEPVAETLADIPAENIAAVREISTKSISGRTYYIIIGSFPTEELAQKRISYFRRKGVNNVSIVQKDDKYRLYMCKFNDKTDANNYLDDVKQNNMFADAWLFSQKN